MAESTQRKRRVLRVPATLDKIGRNDRIWLWRQGHDPDSDFPKAIRIGPNSIGYFEDEIDAWLECRPRVGCPRLSEAIADESDHDGKDEDEE